MSQQSFAFTPHSVADARHYVAGELSYLPKKFLDPICLIVSELATNAIRHAKTGFTLEILTTEDGVRIAVQDDGNGKPTLKNPKPTDIQGRGLQIVRTIANDWGIELSRSNRGKTVWFHVATNNVLTNSID